MTSPRRPMLVALAVALTLALAAAGCTNGDDSADTTTTSAVASSSSSETTSTTAAESEEPTTSEITEEDVEAAVRAAHTFFMVDFYNRDELVNGVEPSLAAAQEILTGPVLARAEESAAGRLARDERIVGPGYDSNIVDIEIGDGTARVLDCSLGQATLFSTTGEVLIEPGSEYRLRETGLILVDDKWLVEEFFTGGDTACQPGT